MESFPTIRAIDTIGWAAGAWLIYKLSRVAADRTKTTKLPGPSAESWLLGSAKDLSEKDNGELIENWVKEFGNVFQVLGPLGERRIVLTDQVALAHVFANMFTFYKTDFIRRFTDHVIGKGIFWAEGEVLKRQRKGLTPAFTNAAIREHSSTFFESAYKVKTEWDKLLCDAPNGEAIIDVQKWMNSVSLDSICLAGFDYDCGTLGGEAGPMEAAFDALSSAPVVGLAALISMLGPTFPWVADLPSARSKQLDKLQSLMVGIARDLLQKTREESKSGAASRSSRSIMGALIKAENADASSTISEEEIISQMKSMIVAGYETTSISMTWALIELSRHLEKQENLRNELSQFTDGNPSYEELLKLPYLDGVLREILRLHPPLELLDRVAIHEDIIPLSHPIKTAAGETVDSIRVGANTMLLIPVRAINRSEAIWGPDAKEFKPERWLDNEAGLTDKAKELQGYHHILTFFDGPRICLGRQFAVTEFKAVLSVLIRNYVLEMRDGPDTKVGKLTTLLPRPKVVGEEGYRLPMRVRRFEY